ncbi:MAG TPA: ABC transporter permease [Gammaproteobacteria bacterium]|nr:ABC transporter permease [Gammaproteobacteria bacterium]
MGSLKTIVRRLLRTPAFTAVAVVTLAIGIGANTAIFSVLNGVLLKPLPYPDPDRLISMNHTAPGVNVVDLGSAPFLYFTEREKSETLESVGLWGTDSASVTGGGAPEQVRMLGVSQEILPMLGAEPRIGRAFDERDASPGAPRTLILTHGYWQRRFGGDASAIGKTLTVDGEAREIIGVMPASFRFLDRQVDLIEPFQLDRSRVTVGNYLWSSIARMKPGVTLEQASADVARMIPIAIDAFPLPPGTTREQVLGSRLGPNLRPLEQEVVGDVGDTLWVLMAAIGLVLLIACANVANLLLVRAEGRRQEMAIRAALGAAWTRIARELVLESVVLSLLGGALGLVLADAGLGALLALAPSNLPRLAEIGIDPAVLAFAFGASLLSGVLFGSVPAVRYARAQLAAGLHAGGRAASASRERRRTRGALVTVQVALASVLMVGAGLMLRTFLALTDVDPGFARPAEVLEFGIILRGAGAADAAGATRSKQQMLDRIGRLPGVTAAAFATSPPLGGGDTFTDLLIPEGRALTENERPRTRRFKFVSPGFFAAAGTPLIAGRDVTWTDAYATRPVALVSENLARLEWGGPSEALGKRLRGGSAADDWREIVGVVADVRDDGIAEPAPGIVYVPAMAARIFNAPSAVAPSTVTFLVRSPRTGTPGFLDEVRAAVWSVNPSLPLANVRTLADDYDRSLARTSLTLVLLSIAGTMALLLGVVGIYGVVAYTVAKSTREIGIRMALGAQHGEVQRVFVRQALAFGALGIVLGLGAAAALSRVMASLLFGVSAIDPVTNFAAGAVLIAAVALASYWPARRATRIDPLEALRAE